MIGTEKSDLTDMVSAAIKATFNTRSPTGVERCIDVLTQLKSLSLSLTDILSSDSIFKLDVLKKHRNPKIRKEAQALFESWHKTLKTQATRDNSYKVGLIKLRLKLKKPLVARCWELKNKDDEFSLIHESIAIKKNTSVLKLKTREDEQRPLTHLTEKFRKETKKKPLELMKKEDQRSLIHDDEEIEKMNRDEKGRKRSFPACKAVTMKQTRDEHNKMFSVTATATAIPQRSRQKIKDKDRQTSNTACKKQKETGAVEDSGNPKFAALKSKTEDEMKKKKTEFLELFKVAKKAADLANAKGLLMGKAETSRCVEALSLLKTINITPEPKDSSEIMEKLNGLTTHKDRKICNAASALLNLWRQRITDQQQRKHSATKTFRTKSCKAH